MAFDFVKQMLGFLPPSKRIEAGCITIVSATIDEQTFTIPSKLSKVLMGIGFTKTDGLRCVATTGVTSGGKVTWTRIGPIETSLDDVQYILIGH